MTETENAYRPEPLQVVTADTGGVTVVTVAGEIDHHTAAPLIEALEAGSHGERPRVVIDMQQVAFMDSSGINVLLIAHRNLTAAEGWLRLAGVQPSVMRTLDIVGVDQIITCHPTVSDALTL
ncbi:STAS domain-containing protein [Streptomyces sp. NPDC015139]|uniref:STAS domain-containing protein n=1 Tax=Streptomyces sp. NPDC015139 TaxID=3364942 RepID=UPI0037020491